MSVASRYAALAKRAQADSQAKAADIQARVDAGEITHEQGMAEGQQFADQIKAGFADIKKDSGPISGLKRIAKEIDPAAAIVAPVAYGATAAAGAGAEALGAELPSSIDELTGAAGIEEEAEQASEDILQAEREARELNIERYGEAKEYMMPWMEDARTARDQQMIELGLAPGERGAYMETGGYQDLLSER
ncbi:hypothetical protein KAR91_47200, partial [Candidatus Pacearchaeota archaeon]|nr:hypothetical protein [Candidatus Pacearchaeota archaeon]